MSLPNLYTLLCREIFFLWQIRRQAGTETTGGTLLSDALYLLKYLRPNSKVETIARGSSKEVYTWSQFHLPISCVLLGSKFILSSVLTLPFLLLTLNPGSRQGEKAPISFTIVSGASLVTVWVFLTCWLPAWEAFVFC